MNEVISKVELFIDGVKIEKSLNLENCIHGEYIKNLKIERYSEEKIKILAEIKSDNKDKNYLIYNDLKEFCLRLFSLFGVNVKIESSSIDTDSIYIEKIYHKIKPPMEELDITSLLKYSELVRDSLIKGIRNGEFYNLIESNQGIDMIHRFRSLFSVFDNIAPKGRQGKIKYIDYDSIKGRYEEIINSKYSGFDFARYKEMVEDLIASNLIDERADGRRGKNYSEKLKTAFESIETGKIIDELVSYSVLKCIQVVRNKVNHGDFEGLTPRTIKAAYELLLPITQDLMKKQLLEDEN